MKPLAVENELRDVVSRLILQVQLATSQGRTDINVALEDALIPVLQSVYNLPNLKNLNRKQKNFPGIDLGDEHDRVAYQVTSTTSLEKVKKTVGQFKERNYRNSFDELFMLMLVPKQSSYSQESVEKVIDGDFSFDVNKNIVDLSDVLRDISGVRLTAQIRILQLFRQMLGDVDAMVDIDKQTIRKPKLITTNLQTIDLPQNIYVAEISLDVERTIDGARKMLGYKRRKPSKRTLVKMALLLEGINRDDWVVYENRLFSFSDIETSSLSCVVSEGSTEKLAVDDLAESAEIDNVNILKQLLIAEVTERLHDDRVDFHRKERLFFFRPFNDETIRKEKWKGKKQAVRTVYELKMRKKDPEKVDHHKHLAFRLTFSSHGNRWHAQIVPTYLHTFNGYVKSFYNDKLLARQKRLDRNPAVRNAVRFIAFFLARADISNENTVLFGDLVSFEDCVDADDEDRNLVDEDGGHENGPAGEMAA